MKCPITNHVTSKDSLLLLLKKKKKKYQYKGKGRRDMDHTDLITEFKKSCMGEGHLHFLILYYTNVLFVL